MTHTKKARLLRPWFLFVACATFVAAAEHREAAFGGAAVAKSDCAVCQADRALRVYDGCAAERSLAVLGSCYTPL